MATNERLRKVPLSEVADQSFDFPREKIVEGVKRFRAQLIAEGVIKATEKDAVLASKSSKK